MASFDHFLARLALACCTTSSFEYSDIAERVPSGRFGIMKLCINRCMSWHIYACRVMAFFVHMIIYNLPASSSHNCFTGILLILMASLLALMDAKIRRKCLEPPVLESEPKHSVEPVVCCWSRCRKPRLLLIRPEEVPERAVRAA